jgi:hypothetical protein
MRVQAVHNREHSWYISLHYVEVVHFTHNSCPALPEVASLLNTFEVSGKRFTIKPLQRHAEKLMAR